MNANGFLIGLSCKCCGRKLQGEGEGRPAESYAGTYTGLCYDCEFRAEFKERTCFDGAEIWSFPPHCPAWRRDRESFIGYSGCLTCEGKGRKWISRPDSRGGSYTVNCPDCRSKFDSNTVRKHWRNRWEQLNRAAKNRFAWIVDGISNEDYIGAVRNLILNKYHERIAKWNQYSEKRRLY